MSKRARRDGGTVHVFWPPGEVNDIEFHEIVETGHFLSAEAPAAMRDDLIRRDGWSEVQDSSGSKPKDDDKDGDS